MERSERQIKVRLNLKINQDLRDWVVDYSRRHGVTVTSVICGCLMALRRDEEQTQDDIVEQV